MQKSKKKIPASICWFEIPADKPQRAAAFYKKLFGWQVSPFPGVTDYWHLDTGGPDASPDGGLMRRMHPAHTITQYVLVPSVNRAVAKIKKLGGDLCKAKTAVPGKGYFALCHDTEKNTFAVWEVDPKAK